MPDPVLTAVPPVDPNVPPADPSAVVTQTPEQIAEAAKATEAAKLTGQTPEQIAEAAKAAEAAKLAAETPEQKATREAAEKVSRDTKAAEEAANKVPEKYEDFIVPEGVPVDKAVVEEFKVLAKELGLPQAKAQKLVDFQAAGVKKAAEVSQAFFDQTQTKWQAEIRSDAVVGGANYDAAVALANGVLAKYGSADLVAALATTGLGNHVGLVKLLHSVGKAVGEDQFLSGAAKTGGGKSAAELFYTNPTSHKKG